MTSAANPIVCAIGRCGHLSRAEGTLVIAVTASAMTFSQPEIMAAGFDAYQTKPISVKEFLETVRAVLDGRHLFR